MRVDSEFYAKANLKASRILESKPLQPLTDFLNVSDGNHMSISEYFTENEIPYYRGGDIYNFFIEQTDSPLTIPQKVYNWPHMKRSHLRKGDVLVSIVGAIIGNLSLVKTDDKATCSCKLAILRPKDIEPEFVATFLKTKYGQNQIQKFRRGSGQTGLILEDFDQLLIPRFIESFRNFIKELIEDSFEKLENSIGQYLKAEILLLEAIGLQYFTPSQENTNIKSFQDSFLSSGRLDAEYYQPKYENLISSFDETIETKRVEEIQIFNRRGLQPIYVAEGEYDVINSKHIKEDHLDYDGFEKTDERNFDDQTIAHVQRYDVLTYTTGAYVGRTNVYLKDTPALASNHVNILRLRTGYDPIYIGYVMNSLVGRMQTERVVSGSAQAELYPKDIASFIIPFPKEDIQNQIKDSVQQSLTLKHQSENLLEVAKRAVEIAIEQDETAAMRYIEENQ